MSSDDIPADAKQIAEDYRRQRQAAEARKAGLDSLGKDHFIQWLRENDMRLLSIVTANGFSERQARETVDEYRALIEATEPGSEYDNPSLQIVLTSLLSEIERVCSADGVPVGDGVVLGAIHKLGIDAYQLPVLTTRASIIAVSAPLIMFCNGISKILTETLLVQPDEGVMKVLFDPAKVIASLQRRPDLVRRWFYFVGEYASTGGPPRGSSAWRVDVEKLRVRADLLYAMEWFVVAHEFGHHVAHHARAGSSSEITSTQEEELSADIFARAVSMRIGSEREPQNFFAMAGVGAVVFLGTFELVTRCRAILESGTPRPKARGSHPPFAERISSIAQLDANAPKEWQQAFVDTRRCFAAIIEGVWSVLQPGYQKLHELGVRPAPDVSEFEQAARRIVS